MGLCKKVISVLVIFLVLGFLPGSVQGESLEKRLENLEQQLKEMVESAQHNNKRLAEALASFDQIREDMAAVRGEIEKIRHEVDTEAQERNAQLQKMDHRLSRMDERLGDMGITVKDVAEFKGKESPSKKKQAEKLLYDEAFSELTRKNYKTATQLFQKFLKQYPKSSLADNAQYWRGECFFALGDFEKAILEFQKVIKKYPKGNKVTAAILKQGYAFIQLKAYADAKAFFELLIAEHPKTQEALRANEKIAEVDQLIAEASKKNP
jgi:tol-pal system protein YbgF